jgi:4-amino-4-deoxy-L-arabinose transferase-like glycosyltransferase
MQSTVDSESRNRVTLAKAQAFSHTHTEFAIGIALFLFCVAYLSAFCRYSALEPDEGIVLAGAERILRGEVPYRDFFSFYTPGSFYLLALLFRVFGDSLTVARTSLAVTGASCSVITYVLARRVCGRSMALFAALLTTITGVAYRFLVLHNWYSTLLCCIAVYAAVQLIDSRKSIWAFATGSLVGLTILFEQSKGVGLCLGLAAGFLALRVMGGPRLFRRSQSLALAFAFLSPLILTFTYFGYQRTLGVMLQDWLWPLHHYTQANHVLYGWQNWPEQARDTIFYSGPAWLRILKALAVSPGFLIPILPLIAVGVFAYMVFQVRTQKVAAGKINYYVLMSAVFSGLLISVLIVRADIIHLMYLAPLWYVVLAWILGAPEFQSPALITARPYFLAYIAVTFGLMGFALLLAATGAQNLIQTRRGVIKTSAKDTVVEYVQAHVPVGQEVLVYPYLPLYNYLSATRSPSRYDYFQPGMNTREQAQEIVTSLQSHEARPVLFEPGFAEKFANSWAGTPLNAIANDPVADYIVRNYRVCQVLNSASNWRFEYMVRREETCP